MLLQLVGGQRGVPTEGPHEQLQACRSAGHAQLGQAGLRDFMSTTGVRPQHTCLSFSVLC